MAPLVTPATPDVDHPSGPPERSSAGEPQQVRLTPQAQANLRLVTRPLKPGTYWRTAELPGTVVDRPARSDRGVIAPVTGVVTKVHHFPGDTLFTVRLLSEAVHLTQSDLFKTTHEVQLTQEQKKRKTAPEVSGAVSYGEIIELDNQLRRLTVAAQAYRQELMTRGLSPDQIEEVARGKFVSEIRVAAPPRPGPSRTGRPTAGPPPGGLRETRSRSRTSRSNSASRCRPGRRSPCSPTTASCTSRGGRSGRRCRSWSGRPGRAGRSGWTSRKPPAGGPGGTKNSSSVKSPTSSTRAAGRSPSSSPLRNQSRAVETDGRTLLLCRFRPGQKVRLHVRVEEIPNVFVLPADAVVREGPDAYVFRQNGDLFDRKPVRVVHQDRDHAVVANDGSVPPGLYVAVTAAAQLNRAMKAGAGGTPAGVHVHADGSVHENHALVTQPVETALLGAAGVQAVRSQSGMGLVVVYVEFGWETEVRAARQTVQERLATVAGTLPPGVRPAMTPPSSVMGQILHAGLSRRTGPGGGDLFPVGRTDLLAEWPAAGGDLAVWRPVNRADPTTWERLPVEGVEWDAEAGRGRRVRVVIGGRPHEVAVRTPLQRQMDLRATADWVVRPRLLQIPGVAEVLVMGGDRKQYQVLVDPNALIEYGVTLQQVERAVRENNLNASGGFTLEGQTERPVRVIGRLGPLPENVADDLRKVPVKATPHRTVLLGHVAAVGEGPEPKRGDGGIDGRPGVVVTVVKQPHADTRRLTDEVKRVLRDIGADLPADHAVNTDLFQLKGFIDRGVANVGEALAVGAGLVVVVLFLFLLNLRTTVITLTAIPLSLAVTAVAFRWVGGLTGWALSVNVMTLGGVAVAMGELVDDAIVDVENIFRRLRENHARADPRPALAVVSEASREVRSAVVFGTAVVVLAFLPLFALSGVEGRLFAPLGVAYVASILASLAVSPTVTPVLSYYLLPQSRAAHRTRDGLLLRVLKWGAGHLVRLSMRRAGVLLVLTWAAVGACGWLVTTLGTDFLPRFDEGSVQINVSLPPGSSLRASNEAAAVFDARLLSMQKSPANPDGEVLHFVRRTGLDELDEHAEPVSRSEYILAMNPESGRPRDDVLRTLLAGLKDDVPGGRTAGRSWTGASTTPSSPSITTRRRRPCTSCAGTPRRPPR